LCLASLIIAGAGVALTLIGTDLMRILIVTQAQPWRWLWLSSVIAVLVIPLVARDAWDSGPLGRTSAMLMAASWIFRADAAALIVTALAVMAAAASHRSVSPQRTRYLYLATFAIGAVALLFNLTGKGSATAIDPTYLDAMPGGGPAFLQ